MIFRVLYKDLLYHNTVRSHSICGLVTFYLQSKTPYHPYHQYKYLDVQVTKLGHSLSIYQTTNDVNFFINDNNYNLV